MQTRLARALTALIAAVALALTGLAVTPAQAATGTITGKVQAKDGATTSNYQGANLYLARYTDADDFFSEEVGSATSSSTGTFSFPNLANGRYRLRIYPAGEYSTPGNYGYEYYDNGWSPYESTTIVVSGGTVTLNSIVLEKIGWVTGKVTDQDGAPVPNANINVAKDESSGGYGFRTDANGNYDTRTFPETYNRNLIPGTYSISSNGPSNYGADEPVYASTAKSVTVSANAGTVANIQINRLKTTVFTVLDTNGKALKRSPIELLIQRTPGGAYELPQYGPIETDDQGKFRLIEPNNYKLRFRTPAGYTGTGVPEWWNGPAGQGASSVNDAAVVDWPAGAPYERAYTVRLDPAPVVTGTAQPGRVVTATSAQWDAGTTQSYQWLANSAVIPGATSRTLPVTKALIGKSVAVRVTGTLAGTTVIRTSKATKVLGKLSAGTPKITGTAKVGKVLTAKPGTWSPKPSFSYQWLRNGKAIKGAKKAKYKLAKKDRGKRISVKVTGKKANYATVTKTSKRTAKVKR
ncbi:carboxypeptidase regulatory-like domain-containing protein [Nocardioides dubius]|uniref:Alpha-amylase n=1 Tax=Nocardioides dubius TaxID=317019 RepID=A0ABP4EA88_9ACTN